MITVVSVNFNTLEWMRLLVKSIRKFTDPVTRVPIEILIVDNNSSDGSREWLAEQKDIWSFPLVQNIGHGHGLDFALTNVTTRFFLILDIDAHIQRYGWDVDLIRLYQMNPKRKCIAARGNDVKPIHPCVMFGETKFFRQSQLQFYARDGYDVGRRVWFDIDTMGFETLRLSEGYEGYEDDGSPKKFYPGVYGTQYYLYSKPTFYHEWYSGRMALLDPEKNIDGYVKADYLKNKRLTFSMPLVKEILAFKER